MNFPIEVRNLRKSFGKRRVLNALCFQAEAGQITGVAGPNASGKTTLLKCILGLVLPDAGTIFVHGQPVESGPDYRRHLGYVPQIPEYPPNLKVSEILAMLEGLRRERAPRKEELIGFFGLHDHLQQLFGQLSGGTKQKVACAIAMMFDAPILVLDEPAASLDPLSAVRLKDLLTAEAGRGKTILLVSHAMSELEQIASHLLFMIEGSAAYSGPIENLKQEQHERNLERAVTGLVLMR